MKQYGSFNKRESKHQQKSHHLRQGYFDLGWIGKFSIRAKLKELEQKLDGEILRQRQTLRIRAKITQPNWKKGPTSTSLGRIGKENYEKEALIMDVPSFSFQLFIIVSHKNLVKLSCENCSRSLKQQLNFWCKLYYLLSTALDFCDVKKGQKWKKIKWLCSI